MANAITPTSAGDKFRSLPSVSDLLATVTGRMAADALGHQTAVDLSRAAIDEVRSRILFNEDDPVPGALSAACEAALAGAFQIETAGTSESVINATGVIVHTNLGRAPLSENARNAMVSASGYTALEFDLRTGKRGRRGSYPERLLCRLTGAEAALIVNNCAAAAFLVLAVLGGRGKGVIVSRGELVEIGGDFRVPDVLERSGCELKEVGTTNRTKVADYERAISENTAILMRVHPSNYKITGFTSMPSIAELADLAREHGLILYEDAGSGALVDLSMFGLSDEPLIPRSIADGADIVTFSGDKLLGGPQAGLIVGKRELIDAIRRDPLYRALRTDKVTNAALAATLEAYARGTAMEEIPVLKMLSATAETITARAEAFAEALRDVLSDNSELTVKTLEGSSVVGGGAAPGIQTNSRIVAISGGNAEKLSQHLRNSSVPIVARIAENNLLIDLRTVFESQETALLEAFRPLAFSRSAS